MQRSWQWAWREEDGASCGMELATGTFGGEAGYDGCSKKPAQERAWQGDCTGQGTELAMGASGGDASNGALAIEPEGHGSFLIK